MIILSIVAASLVTFIFPGLAVRPIFLMWFLFICPGMVVVRFFQLEHPMIEWSLALALSIAIDAFIAGILLYAGWWSPVNILLLLLGFCFIGVIVHIIVTYLLPIRIQQYYHLSDKIDGFPENVPRS